MEDASHERESSIALLLAYILRSSDLRYANAPPASRSAVAALPEVKVTEKDKECPVCLKVFVESDKAILMACKHLFHKECILNWLEKTNSCPVCRYEMPTDNEEYEFLKKEKEREKVREEELKILHNSMYI